MSRARVKSTVVAVTLAVFAVTTAAQTPIVAPKNKYSPADDVKLGLEAAQQVEKELPVMRDPQVNNYLNAIGRRLVESIPSEFQHPEFRYSFTGATWRCGTARLSKPKPLPTPSARLPARSPAPSSAGEPAPSSPRVRNSASAPTS
jgi:hypothetical protein